MLNLLNICLLAILPTPFAQGDGAEKPIQNTIKWSTASEENNFGFNVYRGDTEEGPFKKLNDKPISGGGTTDEPQSYKFVDKEIDPYKAYFYYVESISLAGDIERFTPVLKAPPKRSKDEN